MRKCNDCNGGYIPKMKNPELFDKLFDRYDHNTPSSEDYYKMALRDSGGEIKEKCNSCNGSGMIEFIEIEKYDNLMKHLNEKDNIIAQLKEELFKLMENKILELILSNKQNFINTLKINCNKSITNDDIKSYFLKLFTSKNLSIKDLIINTNRGHVRNVGIEISNIGVKYSNILCDEINEIFKEMNIIVFEIPEF